MGINEIIRIKWSMLKRSRIFLIYVLIMYFALAFADNKTVLLMPGIEPSIYRYIYQQVFIVLGSTISVSCILNEKTIRSIKDFILIYVRDVRNEILGIVITACMANIFFFLLGHFLVITVSSLYYKELLFELAIVNSIIVSIEIIACVLLIAALRLFFQKNIIVFSIFYAVVFVLMILNNVYISIPLTIRIAGLGGLGYYVTFGWQLWLGRAIILGITIIMFQIALKSFMSNLAKHP